MLSRSLSMLRNHRTPHSHAAEHASRRRARRGIIGHAVRPPQSVADDVARNAHVGMTHRPIALDIDRLFRVHVTANR